LWNAKKKNCMGPAIQNKRCIMLTSSVVHLHDNVHLCTATCTWVLLENFKWELFDYPPYRPDLSPNDYHLFTHTYLKKWLWLQPFNTDEELIEVVKTWLTHRQQTSVTQVYKNLFSDVTGDEHSEVV
jgi:hypothetical protein